MKLVYHLSLMQLIPREKMFVWKILEKACFMFSLNSSGHPGEPCYKYEVPFDEEAAPLI